MIPKFEIHPDFAKARVSLPVKAELECLCRFPNLTDSEFTTIGTQAIRGVGKTLYQTAISVRTSAQKSDENDRADDGNDDRTEAAEAIGKECKHTALSRADPVSRLISFPLQPGIS